MLVTRSPVRRSIKKSNPVSNNQGGDSGTNNLSNPMNFDNSGISGISFSPDRDRKFKQPRNVEPEDIKNFAS